MTDYSPLHPVCLMDVEVHTFNGLNTLTLVLTLRVLNKDTVDGCSFYFA